MATVKKFEELQVWQKARQLNDDLYRRLFSGSFGHDFGLIAQLNRAGGSVMDNIAEGFEREGKQEFIQFLSYAKASAGEVRSQLYRARDRNYISDEEFTSLVLSVEEISKMISAFMKYLKKADVSGLKYKL
jgi:four helix bundle protein